MNTGKKLVLVVLASLHAVCGYVQNVSRYGVITDEESKITECQFDKNAEALVLFDVGKFSCFFYSTSATPITTEFTRHVRIKILSEKGLDQANIRLPYYGFAKEKIKNLSAQTYSPDADGKWVISQVEKDLLYDKKISKRLSEIVFAFPNVKAGSIIEYKYTVSEPGLHTWYFQKKIPVRFSSYTVDYPYDFELLSTPICIFPVDTMTQRDKLRTVRTFTMKDILPLVEEPFIGSNEDYMQRVESNLLSVTTSRGRYNLMPGWPSIINDLMEDPDFGDQLGKDVPETAELERQLKPVTDPYTKMRIIHEYIRTNMQWNGYNNIWALNGIKAAWKEKKGTSGEINLILINLLKNAGLDVYPMLASTRENGKVYLERPAIRQFNKVLAYIKIQDKLYVLDATEKNTPPNLIPSDVTYSWGLILKKVKTKTYEWEWQWLWDEERMQKNTIVVKAAIADDGSLHGDAGIYSYEYARVERFGDYKLDSQKFIHNNLIGNSGIVIDSFRLENENIDTLPLVQRFRFTSPAAASGDYKHFSVNLFTGIQTNPFVADHRFSDIFFGVKQQYNLQGSFTAPEGYSFEEMPKDISIVLPDSSISLTRFVEVSKNSLSVKLVLQFKKPFYSVKKYGDFKEFYKKLFDLLNEQYVIRKIKA